MDFATQPDEFKLLADHAPVMMWRASAEGACDWFNLSWLDFTGQKLDAAVGRRGWVDLVHPSDADHFRGTLDSALETREPFSLEYRLRRADGVFRWILDNGKPYFHEGRCVGFLGCCVDITAHRRTERHLRAAMEERDVLLREVHHRVKNNMQTLMALVRFMRRTADSSGSALLDVLNVRLVSMAIVQRYLHAADNMTEVSVRTLLDSMARQIAETELGLVVKLADAEGDLVLPAQAAAYAGLATAEAAVVLAQCGATMIEVELRGEPVSAVEVRGSAKGHEIARSHLGMRLIRQYARGAGAAILVRDGAQAVTLVFQFV